MIVYYKGIELDVNGNYNPEERQTLEHRGYPEEFEIESVEWNGVDVYELFYALDLLPELENKILSHLN